VVITCFLSWREGPGNSVCDIITIFDEKRSFSISGKLRTEINVISILSTQFVNEYSIVWKMRSGTPYCWVTLEIRPP
jgi:hypothetical protein